MIAYRAPLPGEWGAAQILLTELAFADGGNGNQPNEPLLRDLGSDPGGWLAVLLAVNGDEPQGIVTFTPDYSSYRGRVGTYVADLYVSPAARGQHMGRGLLRAAGVEARARWGASFLSLNVHHDNRAAMGFYGSLGFTLREACDYLILEGEALAALS